MKSLRTHVQTARSSINICGACLAMRPMRRSSRPRSAQRANSSNSSLAPTRQKRKSSRRSASNSRQRWRSTQMRRVWQTTIRVCSSARGSFPHRLGNRYMHAARSWYSSKARSTFVPHTTPLGSPRQATRTSPTTISQPNSRSWRRCATKRRRAPLRVICLAQKSRSAARRCF